MKNSRLTKLLTILFMSILLFSLAHAHDDTDWIAPEFTQTENWNDGFTLGFTSQDDALTSACSIFTQNAIDASNENNQKSVTQCPMGAPYLIQGNKYWYQYELEQCNSFGCNYTPTTFSIELIGTQQAGSCTNPAYPISEDLSGNGQPDHCHILIDACPDETSVHVSDSQFNDLCVNQAGGAISCSYYPVANDSGGFSGTYTSSGVACECNGSNGCEDLTEPEISPEEVCGVFGDQLWCQATEDQCENTVVNGDNFPCGNCGTVNDVFMCVEQDAPIADVCTANDARPECEGLVPLSCPVGHYCIPDATETTDTSDQNDNPEPVCTTNDTRESCQGVADGEKPNKSPETKQLEEANERLDDLLQEQKQTNKNLKDIEDKLLGEEDLPDIKSNQEANEESYKNSVDSAFADRTSENELDLKEQGFFTSMTGLISAPIIPQHSCSPFVVNIPNSGASLSIDVCYIGSFIRPILAWIFMIITIIYLRTVIVGSLGRSLV